MSESLRAVNGQVICILGMHRSGTSAVARLLNLLGLYLGSEECLMQSGFDNPKGFWEHKTITALNEEILGCLGGYHLAPPQFMDNWITHPGLESIRFRARQIIQNDFANVPVWGWKDPRNSLTLPFWQDLLPEMRYVICVRNPVDVACSIERRNGVTFSRAAELWLKYVAMGVVATAGRNRMFVFYDDVMRATSNESQRLALFLENPAIAETQSIQTQISQFIEQPLQHYRSSMQDVLVEPRLDFRAKALLVMLRLWVDIEKHDLNCDGEQKQKFQESLNVLAAQAIAPIHAGD